MIEAGVDSLLGGVLGSIRSVVAGAEVGGLDAVSAARLVEECAEAERLLAALRGLAPAALQDTAVGGGGGGRGGPGRGGAERRGGGGGGGRRRGGAGQLP